VDIGLPCAAKHYLLKLVVIFSATTENFNAKFHTLITYLQLASDDISLLRRDFAHSKT